MTPEPATFIPNSYKLLQLDLILQHADAETVVNCMQVCKYWNAFINRNLHRYPKKFVKEVAITHEELDYIKCGFLVSDVNKGEMGGMRHLNPQTFRMQYFPELRNLHSLILPKHYYVNVTSLVLVNARYNSDYITHDDFGKFLSNFKNITSVYVIAADKVRFGDIVRNMKSIVNLIYDQKKDSGEITRSDLIYTAEKMLGEFQKDIRFFMRCLTLMNIKNRDIVEFVRHLKKLRDEHPLRDILCIKVSHPPWVPVPPELADNGNNRTGLFIEKYDDFSDRVRDAGDQELYIWTFDDLRIEIFRVT